MFCPAAGGFNKVSQSVYESWATASGIEHGLNILTRRGDAGLAVKAEELPLAEGWATAQDGEGRTYFWHKVTKKVQWERPMADTPA